MNLSRARMKFAIKTEMVPKIKFNYMNEKAYERSNWSCDFCLKSKKIYKPDSLGHVIECDEFKEMRNNVDMSNEINVVDYFAKIVKKRNELTVP